MSETNIRYDLMSRGIFIDPMIDISRIAKLVKNIRPLSIEHELIRIGSDNDGGYLVPNDLNSLKACFSPGVDNTASFEQDLWSRQIGSHLADYSVENVPAGTIAKSFIRKFLGANTKDEYISLDDWVNNFEPNASEDDLILQMDIEGSEYETLLACSQKTLDKFRIMVIEFHSIETWGQSDFFKIVEATFNKLLLNHAIVHLHPNNATGTVNMNGFNSPRVFEVTLIKKSRITIKGYANLPHPLDRPNLDYLPPLNLPEEWQHL